MTDNTATIGGWTWTASVGLLYGESPTGERVTVARPLMTSPWWTLGDPELIEASDPIIEGTVFPLFPSARQAIDHVIASHRPPLTVEPESGYEVWKRDCLTGEETLWGGSPRGGYPTAQSAQFQCNEFTEDQKYHDRHAPVKPTREYFVVEVIMTRRRFETPGQPTEG